MSTEYTTKKKSGIGKTISIIILILVLGVGGYGYFWFNGLNAMPDEIKNAKIISTTEMVNFYKKSILQKSSAAVQLDIAQSKYTFSRLYNETNFFHLPTGSPIKINSFSMYPDGNNMHLAMEFALSGGKTGLLPSAEEIIFGTQTAYAAQPFAFLADKKYGITATLSLKTLPEGIGMKPITVSVGNSPLPVGVAMSFAQQYAPSMTVTKDGYIVIKPTQIIDANTNKVIGTLSGLEVKDGKSYITIK